MFGQVRYVDKLMMNVGYQESDNFIWFDCKFIKVIDVNIEEDLEQVVVVLVVGDLVQYMVGVVGCVEYDMDE